MMQAQDRGRRGPDLISAGVDGAASVFLLGMGAFFWWQGGKNSASVSTMLAGMGIFWGGKALNALKKMRAADAVDALEAEIPEILIDSPTRQLTAADMKSISFEPRSEWDGDAKSHPIDTTTWPVEDVETWDELGSDGQIIALIPLNSTKTVYQPVLLDALQHRLQQETIATIHVDTGEVEFSNFYNVSTKLQDVIIVTGEMFNEIYNPDYRPADHFKMD